MEILNCICGHKAELHTVKIVEAYWVKCTQTSCWHGKAHKTIEGASIEWNVIMGFTDSGKAGMILKSLFNLPAFTTGS